MSGFCGEDGQIIGERYGCGNTKYGARKSLFLETVNLDYRSLFLHFESNFGMNFCQKYLFRSYGVTFPLREK